MRKRRRAAAVAIAVSAISLPIVSADIAGMPNGSSQLIALTQD